MVPRIDCAGNYPLVATANTLSVLPARRWRM